MTKLFSIILLFLISLTGFAQTPSFGFHSAYIRNGADLVVLHGDLNGDGREDVITVNGNIFSSLLSIGTGFPQVPAASYTLPGGSTPALLADFNGDGKLDLVVRSTSSPSFYLYFGNGDGTFRAPVTHTASAQLEAVGAADVNRDNKTDLLVLTTSDQGNTSDLQVLLANGDGTFLSGPTTHGLQAATRLLTGDFDGDGKADLALQQGSEGGYQFEILSGDGTGNFAVTYTDSTASQGSLEAADVNGDGITDLISTGTYYCVGCTGEQPFLMVFYGSTNRTLQYAPIPTSGCPTDQGGDQIAVADFNGDGIPDIAFSQNDNCTNPTGGANVAILSGKGNNKFGSQTSVFSDTIVAGPYAVRHTIDTSPDLVYTEANPNSGTPDAVIALTNQTSGNFPTCSAQRGAVGISVCSPAFGSTVSSPVNFAIGAAGDTPMQRVEVWVDGKKAVQQFAGAFSNYSFLNASLPLAAGSHRITIFAAGTDNSLESKTFTLNVGGSSCTAPSSAGVHVCSPANGSPVSSPVHVQAVGKVTGTFARMEVWVDGVKKYTGSTATLNATVALAAGSHRFAFFAINTAGQKWETVVQATVQ